MPRSRTTKGLAKRIALDFFKRKSPLRRLRSRIAWAAGLAAAVIGLVVLSPLALRWLRPAGGPAQAPAGRDAGARAMGGDAAAMAENLLSPGALSEAHAQFERDCASCHGGSSAGVFLAKVSGETCKVCHDGPLHHPSERSTPECSSCHAEHKGRRLAKVRDAACTSCHADLDQAIAPGAPGRSVEARVTRFTPRTARGDGHPEFDALDRPDPGRLRLNHKAHLRADLLLREGLPPLECAACHEPDRSQSFMAPVSYEQHCARCHRLEFDAGGRFGVFPPGSIAPHDTPRSVDLFLTRAFSEEITLRPGRIAEPDPLATPTVEDGSSLLLGRDPPGPAPRNADEWVAREVATAEKILFGKDCVLCHELSWPDVEAPRALPAVAAPRVPERWLARARFDHRSHRLLDCEECHQQARTSTASADVLLPDLAVCAECHRAGGARDDCALCHDYHDKLRERPIRGTRTLPARASRQAAGDETPPVN